eukprot:g817.t1
MEKLANAYLLQTGLRPTLCGVPDVIIRRCLLFCSHAYDFCQFETTCHQFHSFLIENADLWAAARFSGLDRRKANLKKTLLRAARTPNACALVMCAYNHMYGDGGFAKNHTAATLLFRRAAGLHPHLQKYTKEFCLCLPPPRQIHRTMRSEDTLGIINDDSDSRNCNNSDNRNGNRIESKSERKEGRDDVVDDVLVAVLKDENIEKMQRERLKKRRKKFKQYFSIPVSEMDAIRHAEYALGCIFREGRGVVKNEKEALFWFERSGLKGNHYALFNAASMLLSAYQDRSARDNGTVDRSTVEWRKGLQLAKAAASLRNGQAMLLLAVVLSDEDTVQALKWFRLSQWHDINNDSSESIGKKIENRLTDVEKKRARELAESWIIKQEQLEMRTIIPNSFSIRTMSIVSVEVEKKTENSTFKGANDGKTKQVASKLDGLRIQEISSDQDEGNEKEENRESKVEVGTRLRAKYDGSWYFGTVQDSVLEEESNYNEWSKVLFDDGSVEWIDIATHVSLGSVVII